MISLCKKLNMICYDKADLERLFLAPSNLQLIEEINKNGYTFNELEKDLWGDRSKMQQIIDSVNIVNDKEEEEIFKAIYIFHEFYPNSKICFYLKDGIIPKQIKQINSLEKLKKSLKENDIRDIAILTDEGLIDFQLTSLRESSSVENIVNSIIKKLRRYGNNLGSTNLLLTLQKGGIMEEDLFEKIYSNLINQDIEGIGHILIAYNENNEFSVINTVYPILGTKRIEIYK